MVCETRMVSCSRPSAQSANRVSSCRNRGSRATIRPTGEEIHRVQCKKCLVAGRVQGVFYRGTAQRRAQELAIRGYARNLPDGRVEVVACGENAAVETFVSWLWTGSSASKVTSVAVEDLPPDSIPTSAGFQTS
jgi:acylphosphatase